MTLDRAPAEARDGLCAAWDGAELVCSLQPDYEPLTPALPHLAHPLVNGRLFVIVAFGETPASNIVTQLLIHDPRHMLQPDPSMTIAAAKLLGCCGAANDAGMVCTAPDGHRPSLPRQHMSAVLVDGRRVVDAYFDTEPTMRCTTWSLNEPRQEPTDRPLVAREQTNADLWR